MPWRRKEPGHQQPWYWPSATMILTLLIRDNSVPMTYFDCLGLGRKTMVCAVCFSSLIATFAVGPCRLVCPFLTRRSAQLRCRSIKYWGNQLWPNATLLTRFLTATGPYYQFGLTLNPALISYYIHHSKMRDEITFPFPNFNGYAVQVWEWESNSIPHILMDVITYPC